jgi:DNA repair protein RecN (Recombination protein N)
LTKPEHQKTLLDGYTGEYALTQRMAEHYRQWHQSCRELAQHQQQSQERAARADLLQYQLKELNEFNPRRVNSSKLTKSTSAWPTAASCSAPASTP